MYDPGTSRWMTPDPIGFDAGDVNLYRYVGNSPTNATDPSGLENRLVFRDLPNGVTDIWDQFGNFVGGLTSIDGVPHVRRGGRYIPLEDVISQADGYWFVPGTREAWDEWFAGSGREYNPESRNPFADVDAHNTGIGLRGTNNSRYVPGTEGREDLWGAGRAAAETVRELGRHVSKETAWQIAGMVFPAEKLAEFLIKRGYRVVKEGSRRVLVNVNTGAKVCPDEVKGLANDAAKEIGTARPGKPKPRTQRPSDAVSYGPPGPNTRGVRVITGQDFERMKEALKKSGIWLERSGSPTSSSHRVLDNGKAVIRLRENATLYSFLHEWAHHMTYLGSKMTPPQWNGLTPKERERLAFNYIRDNFWGFLTNDERADAIAYAISRGVDAGDHRILMNMPYAGGGSSPGRIVITDDGRVQRYAP